MVDLPSAFDECRYEQFSPQADTVKPRLGMPPRSTKRSPRRSSSVMSLAGLLVAACCFWQGLPAVTALWRNDVQARVAVAPPTRELVRVPFRDLRPGRRVIAKNPELAGVEVAQRVIDPAVDRLVTFRLPKPDGSFVEWDRIESLPELFEATILETLASLTEADIAAIPASALFAENVETAIADDTADDPSDIAADDDIEATPDLSRIAHFLIGRTVDIDLSELGVSGLATIQAIAPCPEIEPDDGTGRRLVTAVFRHSSSDVYDLQIAGEPTPIGVTGHHPFWSEDRHAFVPANSLTRGEHLRQANGAWTTVTSHAKRDHSEPVFNLEVDGEHVYHVGAGGVLVHNVCPSYDQLRKMTKGTPLEAHHLFEKRFAKILGVKPGDIPALPMSRARHRAFTNAWRNAIPYGPTGTGAVTRDDVLNAARRIYATYPRIIDALGL